jgi:hypothetical protein
MVPLVPGANTITITATDSSNLTAYRIVVINRLSESAAPEIRISSPAAGTAVTQTMVTISGTTGYASGIQRVLWSNSRGGAGQAAGTTSWFASVALQEGANNLTFTAVASDGRQASQSIQIQFTRPKDTTAPSLTITSPISSNVLTSHASLRFLGSVTDSVGVAQVTWSSSNGYSGEAVGTSSWTTGDIPLLIGTNVIVIKARDSAGNVGSRTVVVTRR